MAATPDFPDYAFISIGANLPSPLGTPIDTIRFAIDRLAALSVKPVMVSSIYVTRPIDSPPGTPDFHNAMIAIVPGENETPRSLLQTLQGIENDAARTRSGIQNEARTLDLDIVLFGDIRLASETLTLPHPRAHERQFVMQPLVEIAGADFPFPGTGRTAGAILDDLGDQGVTRLG